MIEWWQALLLSVSSVVVGALLGLGTGFVQRLWTTTDRREAEGREDRRRVGEEQRQAIRQLRRERMKPILDFLEIAKNHQASQEQIRNLRLIYEDNVGGLKDLGTVEELLKGLAKTYPAPTILEVTHALAKATSTASTPTVRDGLISIMQAFKYPPTQASYVKVAVALVAAEEQIEQYLAGTEPLK